MHTRLMVRQEADRQKKQIMESFEHMKKKGKIDRQSLKKLGLDVQIRED